MLKGRKILIGITGGIAAYKIPLLVRSLVKKKAEVKIILTPSAKDFVTSLTLSTLSKNPVLSEFVKNKKGEWNNHVDLGGWADLMLIAPASANTLSKMVSGQCDNLLMAVYLSAKCPVAVAPAMDLDMYKHASTKKNLAALKKNGHLIIPPGTGELASGLVGEGRMAEPEEIVKYIETHFKKILPLYGVKAMVTAGPTYEAIDPVRFIGNHSSGKMGFAIADELARSGAEVLLISGPTALETRYDTIKRIDVTSADEMYKACKKYFSKQDLIIKAAAVADFRPKFFTQEKIKKEWKTDHVGLEATPDILLELGKKKKKGQILIGFALETDEGTSSAKSKIKKKNLDAIILNSLKDKGAGFKGDTNKISIIGRNNKTLKFELKDKHAVAKDIIAYAQKLLKK